MARVGVSDFDQWIVEHLNKEGLDGEVYGVYIIGTLKEAENDEEKREAITDILNGIIEDEECAMMCDVIINKWNTFNPSMSKPKKANPKPFHLQDHVIKSVTTAPIAAGPVTKSTLSAEEKKHVLSLQYNTDDDDDNDDDDDSGRGRDTKNKTIDNEDVFNINKLSVSLALKEQREEQKLEHKMKQERDKKSRELQHQRQLERKEKEKKRTQKQERKR